MVTMDRGLKYFSKNGGISHDNGGGDDLKMGGKYIGKYLFLFSILSII